MKSFSNERLNFSVPHKFWILPILYELFEYIREYITQKNDGKFIILATILKNTHTYMHIYIYIYIYIDIYIDREIYRYTYIYIHIYNIYIYIYIYYICTKMHVCFNICIKRHTRQAKYFWRGMVFMVFQLQRNLNFCFALINIILAY